ncbi:MAG TPA: maleylpyruvate isomerase family mycothiol-dependent enzyme [Jatrophihabitans sp.]|jgi:uncharacterized protein (TIGR03083 family)
MSTLPALFYRLVTTAADFRAVLAEEDLATPVPSCPGWNLGLLGGHLGGVYRFATAGIVDKVALNVEDAPDLGGREALLEWFDTGWSAVSTALREHPWDEECWNFGPKPRTVAFWVRRQCHETVIHLWDACVAVGSPAHIDKVIALDGIDEVLTMFLPRQLRMQRIAPLGDRVRLAVPGGPSYVVGGEDGAEASATITATADALLLLLYRRLTAEADSIMINGDEAAARRVLATELTP